MNETKNNQQIRLFLSFIYTCVLHFLFYLTRGNCLNFKDVKIVEVC